MVAFADGNIFAYFGDPYSHIGGYPGSPFYLYFILMMRDAVKTERKKDLETVAVLAVFFLIFYYISKKTVFIIIALTLLVIAVLFKKIASRIASFWLAFSHILSNVNSKIILTLVFYLVLTPLAFLRRLFDRDHLKLKRNPRATTYFDSRDHTFKREDFEKVW